MNASADFNIDLYYSIYAAIKSIRDEDHEAWMRMDGATLFAKTMRKMQGKVNPIQLRNVINEL